MNYKYGTLSNKQKPLKYNVEQITDSSRLHALIEFGKPNVAFLDSYIMKGFISNSEVESFRVLTDIKLEFVILDLDEERTMLNKLYQVRMNNLVRLVNF